MEIKILPIPGLDVVGRGVILRPNQPFELKAILCNRHNDQEYYSRETGETYLLPEGYAVNDSPPMPAGQALNQTIIEESWERFDKEMGLDTNLAASNGLFSVDVNAGQASHIRSEEDSYYALRKSFVPLWTVYIPDMSFFSDMDLDVEIPVPFKHKHRWKYDRFFERFGSHYVKRAWVGGKATLAFSISKSSQMTRDEIQAGIKASFGVGSAGTSMKMKENKEKLLNNSECTVFGKGGDELQLAALSSLDEKLYNEWLKSVKNNPQIIEMEVQGIWTLIDDREKAAALMTAYKEATIFKRVSAIFKMDDHIYFLSGRNYFRYDTDKGCSEKARSLEEQWPALLQAGFHHIDAAFKGDELIDAGGEDLKSKIFFFRRNQFIRFDINTKTIDEGYPRNIADGFPGVDFERIDAVLNAGFDTLYFFCGNKYIRYTVSKGAAEEGYPESIAKRWVGLSFDRIDAAICWGAGKVYFFRDNKYIRYDMVTYRTDPGYPKLVTGNYVEDWNFFE